MTWNGVFSARRNRVPSMSTKLGGPRYGTVTESAASTASVVTLGMAASIAAARASGVPGTAAST